VASLTRRREDRRVRHSEFWQLAEEVFGPEYARSLASDIVLGRLGGRTPVQGLDAGIPPRDVWEALCDAQDVPPERRWIDTREANRRSRR
jgi:hypothetical protein